MRRKRISNSHDLHELPARASNLCDRAVRAMRPNGCQIPFALSREGNVITLHNSPGLDGEPCGSTKISRAAVRGREQAQTAGRTTAVAKVAEGSASLTDGGRP